MVLKVSEVSKYLGKYCILKSVSLEIDKGEVVGVFGPNGSGKSTLLKIISGIVKPTYGKIIFHKKDITGFPVHVISTLGVVYAFQIPRPFVSLSVIENIMIGFLSHHGKKEAFNKALNICELMDLCRFKNQKAGTLSQGELKLLEIAKALAMEPVVILLDEPFAALDRRNAFKVMDKLLELKSMGYSMIITAHRMRILREVADKFYEMREGILYATG